MTSAECSPTSTISRRTVDILRNQETLRRLRLDEREAPQREIARDKKEADATRTSEEKARLVNKAVFKS